MRWDKSKQNVASGAHPQEQREGTKREGIYGGVLSKAESKALELAKLHGVERRVKEHLWELPVFKPKVP